MTRTKWQAAAIDPDYSDIRAVLSGSMTLGKAKRAARQLASKLGPEWQPVIRECRGYGLGEGNQWYGLHHPRISTR